MTEEVKFIRGNDRINQLAQRPDIADGVNQVRAEMAEADRTYAMGLAALRQAAELTQVELARARSHPGRHQPHRTAPRPAPVHPQLLPRSHRRPRQRHRHLRRRPRDNPRPLTTQITFPSPVSDLVARRAGVPLELAGPRRG